MAGIAQLLEFFETLHKPHCSIGTAVSNLTLSAERLCGGMMGSKTERALCAQEGERYVCRIQKLHCPWQCYGYGCGDYHRGSLHRDCNVTRGRLDQSIDRYFTGGIDFSGWFYALDGNDYASLAVALEAGAPVFAIGKFVMAVINFLIVAFVVFMLVRLVNRIKSMTEAEKEEAALAPAGPSELDILIEIRDALAKK